MEKQTISEPLVVQQFIEDWKVVTIGKGKMDKRAFIMSHANLKDTDMYEELRQVCR